MIANSVIELRDRTVYVLLFLFPLLGMSVRHWISTIFTLLVLISFTYLAKPGQNKPMEREEKILLWIFGIFFAVFLVSAFLNGWTDRQTKYLGVEIRYLLLIPLYLMVRQLNNATKWLLRGCALGGILLGAQSYYDTEVLNLGHTNGIYSSNLIGPFAVLMAFWLLSYPGQEKSNIYIKLLVAISILLSIYTAATSGSRGSYIGLFVLSCLWLFMNYSGKKVLVGILLFSALFLSVYMTNDTVSKRINIAVTEVHNYINSERQPFECVKDGKQLDHKSYLQYLGVMGLQHCMLDGTAIRIEMWRLSWLVFLDNPIWGIGRGNYEIGFDDYIERDLVHPDVNLHGHPHNAYLEVLLSKGLVGFAVFSALLIYPLSRFVQVRKHDNSTAILGVTLIVGYSVFSLTDASTFIKGNYLSIFLVFLTCYFSRVVQSSGNHLAQQTKCCS